MNPNFPLKLLLQSDICSLSYPYTIKGSYRSDINITRFPVLFALWTFRICSLFNLETNCASIRYLSRVMPTKHILHFYHQKWTISFSFLLRKIVRIRMCGLLQILLVTNCAMSANDMHELLFLDLVKEKLPIFAVHAN